jgi:tetratricopeptide (TPR) repeat protein
LESEPTYPEADLRGSLREHLRTLAEQHPSSGQAWYDYAKFLHMEFPDSTDTVTALERAQQLIPDIDLSLRLGDALIQTGSVKEGLHQICQFLEGNPTALAYRLLGTHLFDLGRSHRARKFLRRSYVIDSTSAVTCELLGRAFSDDSKRVAAAWYRKALAIDPEYQSAWSGLGYALLERPETRIEGLDALKKALELDPKDAWSMLCLALGCWMARRLDEADRYYRRVAEENPDDEIYREYYAAFQEKEGGGAPEVVGGIDRDRPEGSPPGVDGAEAGGAAREGAGEIRRPG